MGRGMNMSTGTHDDARAAERLEEIEVLDPDGRRQRLGDLWRDRTVVLAFVRHFG